MAGIEIGVEPFDFNFSLETQQQTCDLIAGRVADMMGERRILFTRGDLEGIIDFCLDLRGDTFVMGGEG